MWGNLAGKIKDNLNTEDLRATIHRIGDAVAPPLDDDEEYETDDEEEYEYYYEEVDVDQADSKPSLGKLLQNALDEEEETHHREEEMHHQHERHVRPIMAIPDEEEEHAMEDVVGKVESSDIKPVVPAKKPEETVKMPPQVVETKKEPMVKKTAASRSSDKPKPAAAEPHHFPGVPVPHVYREQSEQESAKRNALLSDDSLEMDARSQKSEPESAFTPFSTMQSQMVPQHSGDASSEAVESIATVPEPTVPKVQPNENRKKSVPPQPPVIPNAASQPTDTNGLPKQEPKLTVPKSVPAVETKTKPKDAAVPKQPMPSSQNESKPKLRVPSPVPPSQPPKQTAREPSSVPQQPPKQTVRGPSPVPPQPPQQTARGPPPVPPQPQPPNEGIMAMTEQPQKPKEDLAVAERKSETRPTAKKPESHVRQAKTEQPPPPKETVPCAEETVTTTEKIHVREAKTDQPPPLNETVPLAKETKPATEKTQSHVRDADVKEMERLKRHCQDLEKQLQHAETHIVELQQDAAQRMDAEEEWRQSHLRSLQEEQARLVEAATAAAAQEHQRDMEEMRNLLQQECLSLKEQLHEERTASQQQTEQFRRLLEEAEARTDAAELEKQKALSKQKSSMSQFQQQQERSVRMAEDKLAHTMAKLDEREEEVKKLRAAMKELKASTTEHREVAEEAEEEMHQLHTENDMLRQNLQSLQDERSELMKQLNLFESQKEKMTGLQMELRMLKEARDRERAHRESAAVNAESSQAELVAERDAALCTARDLEHQLTATLADLDIARTDTDRVMLANANLQSALEAFQNEREAEMNLLEEQRVSSEEATAAAHAAAIEATHEANEARMREVQMAADAAVKNVMTEVNELQEKLEDSRRDNLNLRRSLDEAIHRLQTSQEDVIDRALMKNILLDWFAKTGKSKRDVLEIMASLLHFTEEEKDAIHIGDGGGTLGKVVGVVAAPIPPSAADIDHLEGESVREKWVNFLLAETGGDEDANNANNEKPASSAANGETR